MTVEEIKEFKDVHEAPAKKEYASKSMAGTALGFGIGGAALGLWSLFGRGNKGLGGFAGPENININGVGLGMAGAANGPTAYQVEQKECADVLALQAGLYNQALTNQNNRFNDRQIIDRELFGLYKSQTDADFNLYKNQRDSYDVLKAEIGDLKTQVVVSAAVRPYQDKLIQCEIDRAFTAGINYVDRKTCRMITGEVVLPNTPVVTGFGSYSLPCNCGPVITPAPSI